MDLRVEGRTRRERERERANWRVLGVKQRGGFGLFEGKLRGVC